MRYRGRGPAPVQPIGTATNAVLERLKYRIPESKVGHPQYAPPIKVGFNSVSHAGQADGTKHALHALGHGQVEHPPVHHFSGARDELASLLERTPTLDQEALITRALAAPSSPSTCRRCAA